MPLFFAILGETFVALFTPLMAYTADRADPYRQYRFGLILVAIFSPCIFLMAASGHYGWIGLSMLIYGITHAIICGPMIKILYDQFPPFLRYTGISFAWSVSAAIFAGTAPLMAQFLTFELEWLLAPSFYVSFIAIFTHIICKYCFPSQTVAINKNSSSFLLTKLTD